MSNPTEKPPSCMVTSCCCGCTLRTGAIIAGVYELIIALFLIGFGIWITAATGILYFIILIVIGLIHLAANISLLNGVRTHSPRPVKCWWWYMFVISVLGLLANLGKVSAGSLSTLVAHAALMIYVLVVVRSYYLQLEQEIAQQHMPLPTSDQNLETGHPQVYPPGVAQVYPPGIAPQGYPPGVAPQVYPPGVAPQGYPPGVAPQGYPAGVVPQGYPPGVAPQVYPAANYSPGGRPTDYPPAYTQVAGMNQPMETKPLNDLPEKH